MQRGSRDATPIELIPYLRRPLCRPRYYLRKPAAFSSSAFRGVGALLARLNSRELQLTRQLPRAPSRLVEISNTGGKKDFLKSCAVFLSCALLTVLCIIMT